MASLDRPTPASILTIAYGGAADAEEVADAIRWVAQQVGSTMVAPVAAKVPGSGLQALTRGEVHIFSFLLDLADRVDALSPRLR